MKQIPSKIYLQVHGDASLEEIDDLEKYDEWSEVTWCEDKIYDTDIEYSRVIHQEEPLALEQAANEYAEKHGGYYPRGAVTNQDCYDAFKAGAEWQKKYMTKGGER